MRYLSQLYRYQHDTRRWLTGRIRRLKARPHRGPLSEISPGRVLLVITGHIGDAVMSTPVIAESRRLWPEASITVLGSPAVSELLAECPLTDDIVTTSVLPFSVRGRKSLAKLSAWMAAQSFDLAIIALGDQFAPMLEKANIQVRVGVRGDLLEPFLTHTYNFGSRRTWGPSERLNALRVLGYEVGDVAPSLWVSESTRSSAAAQLQSLGLPTGVPYAVVHPFGSTRRQWWPPERTVELAMALRSEYRCETVIVGGSECRGYVPESSGDLFDAVGALSVRQLLGVIASAKVVISTDSGPFHVAGALQRPLVGIFRSSRPEHAGRYPQSQVILGHCPPCEHACTWDRCRASPCLQMDGISSREIVDRVARHFREVSPHTINSG